MLRRDDANLKSMEEFDRHITGQAQYLVANRRHLHRYPELSGQEHATTEWVGAQLANADIAHHFGPEKRGIITGILPGDGDLPVLALRADMDALPIREENRVAYQSANEGVMHACGHDAHTAMLLGVVTTLRKYPPVTTAWRGIFQPSEEAGHGARDMITHGALEGVDAIVALHVDPNLYCGEVAVVAGPQSSFCQDFEIRIAGKGGHAARPHLTVDPVAVAAHLVTLIYQALPRNADARDPLVVTIGHMQAGHATNVIPDNALLRGTVRSFSAEVSERARVTIERLCEGTALAFGAQVTGIFEAMLPGVINDPAVTAICQRTALKIAGEGQVITASPPSMGAEDFADYLMRVPGCMMRLGVRKKRKKITPLHTPTFDIDEDALVIGARLLATLVHDWPRNFPQLTSPRSC